MANEYTNALTIISTTSATTVYTSPNPGKAIVNSVIISNVEAAEIIVSLHVTRGGTDYSVITDAAIPTGATLAPLPASLVLVDGDLLAVTCDTANGAHVIVSIMEIT